jgi:hypothetical protein
VGKGTPGKAQLYIDRHLVGETVLPVTIPLVIGITEGLTCGRDDGSTVTKFRRPTQGVRFRWFPPLSGHSLWQIHPYEGAAKEPE